jgi:hypothetical protein
MGATIAGRSQTRFWQWIDWGKAFGNLAGQNFLYQPLDVGQQLKLVCTNQ